jgi:hypothetical protein
LPSDSEIEGFIANTFGGMFYDGFCTMDMESCVEDTKESLEKSIREALNTRAMSEKLTQQNAERRADEIESSPPLRGE